MRSPLAQHSSSSSSLPASPLGQAFLTLKEVFGAGLVPGLFPAACLGLGAQPSLPSPRASSSLSCLSSTFFFQRRGPSRSHPSRPVERLTRKGSQHLLDLLVGEQVSHRHPCNCWGKEWEIKCKGRLQMEGGGGKCPSPRFCSYDQSCSAGRGWHTGIRLDPCQPPPPPLPAAAAAAAEVRRGAHRGHFCGSLGQAHHFAKGPRPDQNQDLSCLGERAI